MRSLLVTLSDLVGTNESSSDYERLIERIKAYPNWAKLAKSAWVIKTDDTASRVRDALWALMDSNDRLFVGVLYPRRRGRRALRRRVAPAEPVGRRATI